MKEVKLTRPYSFGPYNKHDKEEQWIRITEGCPNQCAYCAEPPEFKVFKIPRIIRRKVKVMDMNLLAKPEALDIIRDLGARRVKGKVVYYELVCGIDYRFLTKELAEALHKNRFKNIRFAWDYGFELQYKMRDALKLLLKAGYRADKLTVFMICNWRTAYEENLRKLDLCKVWNVKVADCWFDNQLSPNIKPVYWMADQIKDFRAKCRKHNLLVGFKIDPEVKI